MKRTWKQMIMLVLTAVFIIALFGSTPMQALDSGTSAFHDPFKTLFDSEVIIANELGIASANELLLPSLDDAVNQMYQEQLLLLKERLLDTYQYNRYIVKYTSDSSQSVSEIINGLSVQTKTISNSQENKSKIRAHRR